MWLSHSLECFDRDHLSFFISLIHFSLRSWGNAGVKTTKTWRFCFREVIVQPSAVQPGARPLPTITHAFAHTSKCMSLPAKPDQIWQGAEIKYTEIMYTCRDQVHWNHTHPSVWAYRPHLIRYNKVLKSSTLKSCIRAVLILALCH